MNQLKEQVKQLRIIQHEIGLKEAQKVVAEQRWKHLPALPYLARLLERGEHDEINGGTVPELIVAALDTTAHSIAWLMYNLGANPEVQEKLFQEISSVCKGKPLVEEHLNQVPYLRACIRETYRLNTPAPHNSRILDFEVTIKNHKIPPHVMIDMSGVAYCLDENVFPKCNEYIPERWLKSKEGGVQNHPYLLLPFGIGARMCLGARVAETEMMAFTSCLVQTYKFKTTNGPCESLSDPVARPHPTPLFQFVPRN